MKVTALVQASLWYVLLPQLSADSTARGHWAHQPRHVRQARVGAAAERGGRGGMVVDPVVERLAAVHELLRRRRVRVQP